MSAVPSDEYARLLGELAVLRKQLRNHRVRSVLVKLASMKKKSTFLMEVEKALGVELATHKRGYHLDELLDILETELTPA